MGDDPRFPLRYIKSYHNMWCGCIFMGFITMIALALWSWRRWVVFEETGCDGTGRHESDSGSMQDAENVIFGLENEIRLVNALVAICTCVCLCWTPAVWSSTNPPPVFDDDEDVSDVDYKVNQA